MQKVSADPSAFSINQEARTSGKSGDGKEVLGFPQRRNDELGMQREE